MLAVILAGGKGTRIGNPEKCLLDFCGQPLIEHVLNIVRTFFRKIVVATTIKHRNILKFCKESSVDILITPGLGLCYDLCMLVNITHTRPLIIFPCDLILTRDIVQQVLHAARIAEENICLTFIDERGGFTGITVITYNKCTFGLEFRWQNVKLHGQVYDIDTLEDLALLRSLCCKGI